MTWLWIVLGCLAALMCIAIWCCIRVGDEDKDE